MRKIFKKLKEDDGFTLLEMAIVVLIITALLLLVITNVGGVKETVDENTSEGIVATVETQKVLYEMDENVKLAGSEIEILNTLEAGNYINKNQKEAYLKAKKQ